MKETEGGDGRKEGRKGARGSRERVAHGGPLRLPN